MFDDFLFRGALHSLDPDVAALVDLEAIRQVRKLIMIPSESTIPEAVREAVGSVLGNIYAEGYPPDDWQHMHTIDLLDTDVRLAEFRRNSSPRYYKGTEIAEIVESLAKRRTAERFATEQTPADRLFVNVQPLSGAPANNAVYTAMAQPGDTIMGLNLLDGGHLTHGSPVNRSGLFFNVVAYGVGADERLDYDQMRDLALRHQPKFIIGGFTSYPWAPDWGIMREIADEAGAYLMADVSHVAGLIVAGVYPSPVGIADIISFTTHKTLHGPRGAVLMTHRPDIARRLDRAVFPGEQGGPHVNSIAGLATAMKLAGTEQFHELQKQIVRNAQRMAERFTTNGVRVAYSGTDTHMLLIDVGQIKGPDGSPLSGDIAARLLDIAGVVANRNTIPGDRSPFRATGVRFGTTWVTQRGLREPEMDQLTDAISYLLLSCKPYSYPKPGSNLPNWRAKADFDSFVSAQQNIARLAIRAGIDYEVPSLAGYPKEADAAEEHFRVLPVDDDYHVEWRSIHIYGNEVAAFCDAVLTNDVYALGYGDAQPTFVLDADGVYLSRGVLEKLTDVVYMLHVEENIDLVVQWLTFLSDGYVQFDPQDLHAKIPGPVSVSPLPDAAALHRFAHIPLDADWAAQNTGIDMHKAYFVGCRGGNFHARPAQTLPRFAAPPPPADAEALQRTPLYDLHGELGAKTAPFAGYDMPVWYDSVTAEHAAVRQGAGVFDVAHMGVFEINGPGAERFLNAVATNDVSKLTAGEAHYSYLLDVDGVPLDDVYIYRISEDRFMLVVNASNNDKDWAWLQAVCGGEVLIDPERPWVTAPGREGLTIRDLRAPASGDDRRVDIALQGPLSTDILLALGGGTAETRRTISALRWSTFAFVTLGAFNLIVSRTGYTGERSAYECFVHPEQASAFFKALVEAGATPCGLAARDSLRTEAGLPLYGHELEGPLNMGPAEAGFGSYVKTWKPFFIGKLAYLAREAARDTELVRFRVDNKGLRSPNQGDAMVDARGRVVGQVTSCAVDTEGYQVGLALVKRKYTRPDTHLMVYAGVSGGAVALDTLAIGDKVVAPQAATVLSRFPKRK
ncbi:MAG: glycine cleavage system aminomethyltransferase GcvT [Anaerolineales bacterium]